MEDHGSRKAICNVCNMEMTTIHAEIAPEYHVFVCENCLETAKQNFIWICLHCGSVYIRRKSLVLRRLTDPELTWDYRQCENLQLIQGIDRCIECDAKGIIEHVAAEKSRHGGHC